MKGIISLLFDVRMGAAAKGGGGGEPGFSPPPVFYGGKIKIEETKEIQIFWLLPAI
jgi:hypothetical protein